MQLKPIYKKSTDNHYKKSKANMYRNPLTSYIQDFTIFFYSCHKVTSFASVWPENILCTSMWPQFVPE